MLLKILIHYVMGKRLEENTIKYIVNVFGWLEPWVINNKQDKI